nr:uncharacterized protein C5orf49 homolog isoform X2 [Chrysemys picta bellii]
MKRGGIRKRGHRSESEEAAGGSRNITHAGMCKETGIVSTYDSIFKRPVVYNEKLHRCDREHANSRGLNINDEELARPIAVLSSSEYGRHINQPIEQSIRDYARINRVQAEFYRKNGVTCLLEKPSQSLEPS